jgi:hypothetical protein
MKRRGSSEARIAIFKNVILNNPVREKSFAAREKAVGWAVLSHNLWVLARMEQAQGKNAKVKANASSSGKVKPPAERKAG